MIFLILSETNKSICLDNKFQNKLNIRLFFNIACFKIFKKNVLVSLNPVNKNNFNLIFIYSK